MDLLSRFCLDIGVMGISQSAAQNKISTTRILRSSSRSPSSCTAPNVQQEDALQKKDGQHIPRRRQQLRRRSTVPPKKERALSSDPIHCAKRQVPRSGHKIGTRPNALTRRAPPAPEGNRTYHRNPPTSLHACINGYMDDVENLPVTAHVLLSLARQSVRMQTDAAGRRPFVMDVILDLKDRARGAVSETHMEAYTPARPCNRGNCGGDDLLVQYAFASSLDVSSHQLQGYYDFGDQTSLPRYWADQAARLADMKDVDDMAGTYLKVTSFPESIERSTVW